MQEISTSTAPSKKRRPPLSREQWAQHVATWKASGLSKTKYCAEHDIHETCLIKWARTLGISRDKKFMPVKVSAPRIEMPTGTPVVEILTSQSVRVRLTGVHESSFVVDIIRGLHACS